MSNNKSSWDYSTRFVRITKPTLYSHKLHFVVDLILIIKRDNVSIRIQPFCDDALFHLKCTSIFGQVCNQLFRKFESKNLLKLFNLGKSIVNKDRPIILMSVLFTMIVGVLTVKQVPACWGLLIVVT